MAPKRVAGTLSTHIRETVELLEHKTPAPRYLSLSAEGRDSTSLKSFLYGQAEDYERQDFAYGGNMRQTYTWTEPVEIP